MTTTAAAWNSPPRVNWALIILLAAAAAGLVLGAHAVTRHGTMADVVRNCPDGNIGLRLRNIYTGRVATLCEFEDGQWGRIISEGDHEVTSYANPGRPTANSLTTAIRHLVRGGYTKVEYIRSDLISQIAEILGSIP